MDKPALDGTKPKVVLDLSKIRLTTIMNIYGNRHDVMPIFLFNLTKNTYCCVRET